MVVTRRHRPKISVCLPVGEVAGVPGQMGSTKEGEFGGVESRLVYDWLGCLEEVIIVLAERVLI